MRGVTLHLGQNPGPRCCAGPWSFWRGREALYPEVGVLYGAWICNSVGLLSQRRRRTPLLLDNTAARNLLANYGTNVLECTSPLGAIIVLPGDEKENLASCIDINFVGEAEDVSVTSADDEVWRYSWITQNPTSRTELCRAVPDQPSLRPPTPLTRPRRGPRPQH